MRFHHFAKRGSLKQIRISVASLLLLLSALINTSIVFSEKFEDFRSKSAESSSSTTLARKDTSDVYRVKEGEIELPEERTRSFKKFKKVENGKEVFRVAGQIGPIHYKSDPFDEAEQYKEIDLTLKTKTGKKDKDPDYFINQNGYQLNIWNQQKIKGNNLNYIAKFIRAGESISMAPLVLAWENSAGEFEEIAKPVAGISPEIDNENYTITWKNAFGNGIDFRYNISPDKFFKTVIVNDKSNLPSATIGPDGLKLTIVMSTAWSEVEAKNNYAKGNKNKDLATEYQATDVKDKSKKNPEVFSYADAQNRDLWWLQRPLAWDSSEERQYFDLDYSLETIGDNNFMKLSSSNEDIQNALTAFPMFIDVAITEEKVGASTDDNFSYGTTWPGTSTNSSTLTGTTSYVGKSSSYFYIPGMRFATVPLPQGAPIISASLSLSAQASTAAVNWTIAAEDSDNPGTYSRTPSRGPAQSYAAKTTSTVNWTPSGDWTASIYYPSADISSITQELVNRSGWVSDNSMIYIIYAQSSSEISARQIRMYDFSAGAWAPKFNASYTAPPSDRTISGTVYTAEDKSTNIGAGKTIGLSINGGVATTVETTAGGAFSFTDISSTEEETVALFIDGETEKGSLISNLNSGDFTGIEMFTDKVVLQTEKATTITNATLDTANTIEDADIGYVVTGSNIDFDDGREVYLAANETYIPGGTVELDSFEALAGATFNPEAYDLTIHGSWKLSTTSIFTSSGTATFDGSSGEQTIDSGNTFATGVAGIDNFDFTNLIKNNAGVLKITSHTLVIKTSLTIGSTGVLDLNGIGTLRHAYSGSFTTTWNGRIRASGQEPIQYFSTNATGVAEYYGSGTLNEGVFYYSNPINNLEFTGTGTYPQTSNSLTSTNGYLKVLNNDATINAAFTVNGDYTQTGGTVSANITLYGDALISGGTISARVIQDAKNRDLIFSSNGANLSGNTSYVFKNSSASNRTITLGSGTLNLTGEYGSIHINADGAGDITLDASVNNPNVNSGYILTTAGLGAGNEYLKMGNGTWYFSSSTSGYVSLPDGSVDPGNSTLHFNQTTTSAQIGVLYGSNTYYNVILESSAPSGTFSWTNQQANTILNDFELSASSGAGFTFGSSAAWSFNNIDFVGEGAGTENFSASANYTISGNVDFTGGTFTKGTSTITLNGTGAQTITSAGNTWNNLVVTNASAAGVTFADSTTVTGTFTATTASSKLYFTSGATYAFANISISGQAEGTRILMDSTSHGTPWLFNVSQASPIASYIDVRDSNASGGNTINSLTGGMDRGGNTNWSLNVASGITISGTVYTTENKSATLNSKTVALSVNGAATATTETNSSGQFDFSWYDVATGNTVAVYVDGETEKGSLVTQAADSTTNITGLEVYTGHIVLTYNTAGPMSNTLLATADNVADTDLLVSVSGSDATFTTGNEIWILGGKTYTPRGNVTAGSLEVLATGTFTPEANTITLNDSGTPFTVVGTFTEGTSTVVYAGDSATNITGSTYSNLQVNNAGTTFTIAGSTTVEGVLTITAGELDGSNQTIILSGAGTPFVKTGTFTPSTSTVKYTAGGNTAITAATYNNLETLPAEDPPAGTGWVASGAGDNAYNGTYNTSGTFNGQPTYTNGSKWLYWAYEAALTSNRWCMSSAVADPSSGRCYWEANYQAAGNASLPSTWYITSIGIAPVPSLSQAPGVNAYTFASGTFNINGNYVNGDGTHTVTSNLDTNDPIFNVDGNFTNSAGATFVASNSASFGVASNFTNGSSATFTHSSGTLTLDGQGLQTITASGDFFNNLTITNASTAGVSFADSATLAGTFTDITPSSKAIFNSGSTYVFNEININGQATTTRVTLTSSSSGNAWNLNVTATSPAASNVSVKDSNANKDIDATIGGEDLTGNTHWLFPTGNTAPSNDSLTFTNPYSSNIAVADNTTEWNFRALVTDANGVANLNYVELRLANSADSTQPYDSIKLRWTQGTDIFSEEADTQDAIALAGTSSGDANQKTLNFNLKFDNDFLAKNTNYSVELYSIDDSAATDTDNYADIYQVQALSITLSADSNNLSFGNLLPGSVITGTTITTVTTNYPSGYALSAHDSVEGTNSVLLHQGDLTTRITDYSALIAEPALWPSGTGLGICVFSATGKDSKWGSGVAADDANNRYAGIPQNATVIHSKTGSPTSADLTSIGYKLVVPNTQKTGSYSGIMTYTATGTLN